MDPVIYAYNAVSRILILYKQPRPHEWKQVMSLRLRPGHSAVHCAFLLSAAQLCNAGGREFVSCIEDPQSLSQRKMYVVTLSGVECGYVVLLSRQF
jgi:hypothetical protein